MTPLEAFMNYATAFEATFADDDWSRLEKCFTDDAVYEVKNAAWGCRVEGRDAILAALRKSLDGFDRRMAERQIELRGEPVEAGDTIDVEWTVTYELAGAPDYALVGRTHARLENGRVAYLADHYPDGVSETALAWVAEYAPDAEFDYV
jgi:hypothetical protein